MIQRQKTTMLDHRPQKRRRRRKSIFLVVRNVFLIFVILYPIVGNVFLVKILGSNSSTTNEVLEEPVLYHNQNRLSMLSHKSLSSTTMTRSIFESIYKINHHENNTDSTDNKLSSWSSSSHIRTIKPSTNNNTTTFFPTIIVQLRGELGNHLSAIAHGRGIQLWLMEVYGFETKLEFIRQTIKGRDGKIKDNPKGEITRQVLQRCFPNIRYWDFLGIEPINEWTSLQKQQQEYLARVEEEGAAAGETTNIGRILNEINGKPMKGIMYHDAQPIRSFSDFNRSLQLFQRLWTTRYNELANMTVGTTESANFQTMNPETSSSSSSSSSSAWNIIHHWMTRQKQTYDNNKNKQRTHFSIQVPYLYSNSLDHFILTDRYLDHFIRLFEMDPTCCVSDGSSGRTSNDDKKKNDTSSPSLLMPYENETVFHYRNFATELPIHSRGLVETTPKQTVELLFDSLRQPSSGRMNQQKVAITSRFDIATNEVFQSQIDALKERQQRQRQQEPESQQRDENIDELVEVRIVRGKTDIEDFCFLKNAQHQLIGNFQSTFVVWAAILGLTINNNDNDKKNNIKKRILLYTIDTPELRQRYGKNIPSIHDRFVNIPWTQAILQQSIELKLIPATTTNGPK